MIQKKTVRKLYTLTKLANELSTDSLFTRGGTLHPEQIKAVFKKSYKYDLGKYGTANKGNNVDSDNTPLWYVQRSDSHGAYLQLTCVNEAFLTEQEQSIYNRIVNVWTGV